ncbi:MAG: succinate dehydrogenase cytochrome b subunit [Tenacibaculum sp.]|nr:succinate dehydrogenase cytochrome b subunit [Tenacibaculum sp.]
MGRFFKSSIGRKFAMALSAFFLMFFLLQHFLINITSIFPDNGKTFNKLSYFMGTNPAVQYVLQPILLFGVIYHFVMGFILEIQNRKARQVKYAKNNDGANSTWMSRNMIISGTVILAFMLFHFNDFWVPEIVDKFIEGNPQKSKDYLHHVKVMFKNPIRVVVYVIAFVFLALHLLHGFNSAFQSVGANNKYTKGLKSFSKIYSIGIPLGFIIIALFHFFNQH